MIRLEGVRYEYPGAPGFALDGVDLSVAAAERVILTGPSGSGKSTLLRVVNGLVPHFYGGRFGGRAVVGGLDTRRSTPQELAGVVGTVFQDLPTRFLTGSVQDEITFSLEVAGVRPAEIVPAAFAIADRMGLARLNGRRIDTLSAGEQARLAMAAAVARRPQALVLDEPLTHIDPDGASAAVGWMADLARQSPITLLVAEHRTAGWREFAGRTIRMGEAETKARTEAVWPGEPGPITAGRGAGLCAVDLHLSFGRLPVLRGVDLEVRPGELTGLIGRNGSGKTTLLRCLLGLQRPDRGRVELDGISTSGKTVTEIARRVGLVPQAPSSLLFSETVAAEIELSLRRGPPSEAVETAAWLEAFGLIPLAERYPRDISAGERQRVALAVILAGRPGVLLLDEPTLGMDRAMMDWLGNLLRGLCNEGIGILVATHDPGFVTAYADRAILLADGLVRAEGDPTSVVRADPAYAMAIESGGEDAHPG